MRTAPAPHGSTHVRFVLLTTTWWLTRSGEPPTQRHLAERAGTDTMMTSQVARKLAEGGLLVREDDVADARARRLRLTDSGLEPVAKALKDVETSDAEFFARVDEGFVDVLARLSPP